MAGAPFALLLCMPLLHGGSYLPFKCREGACNNKTL